VFKVNDVPRKQKKNSGLSLGLALKKVFGFSLGLALKSLFLVLPWDEVFGWNVNSSTGQFGTKTNY